MTYYLMNPSGGVYRLAGGDYDNLEWFDLDQMGWTPVHPVERDTLRGWLDVVPLWYCPEEVKQVECYDVVR